MFARINFLLGLGLLILLAFYFAVAYLIVLPLSAVAPGWVRPVAGVAVLSAVGLTVQLLSMAMSSLKGIALYEKDEQPGLLAFASQAATTIGHLGSIYLAKDLLMRGVPIAETRLLVLAALYAAGAALAVHEWRQRKLART